MFMQLGVAMFHEDGIEYAVYNGHTYYNHTHAARYLGMTDSGLRRRMKRIKAEQGIAIPEVILPNSDQKKYTDKRILDVFRKSVVIGREQEWYDRLRRVINEVNSEDN